MEDSDAIADRIEVHLEVGDVLLFVDSGTRGETRHNNSGERRVVIY